MEMFQKIIEMTSYNELINQPSYLIMIFIASFLLYLGIVKKYEPLLLVPIAFGVLISNIPGSNLGVVKLDESIGLIKIAQDYGIINFNGDTLKSTRELLGGKDCIVSRITDKLGNSRISQIEYPLVYDN